MWYAGSTAATAKSNEEAAFAMTTDAGILGTVPLFRSLDDADLQALGRLLSERRLRVGDCVFAKGEAGSSMYIVMSGTVHIFLPPNEPAQQATRLAELKAGEFFGEMALLDDEPRLASAAAATDVVLAELTRDNLVDFLQGSGHAVLAMLAEMSRRLRSTTELLSTHVARDVDFEIDRKLTWGQRLADRVAQWNGSWVFVSGLCVLTAGWIVVNTWPSMAFDVYPYQFFNLFLAIVVALQGPLIMMSQNRQAMKDRLRSETDFRVNLKNEVGIEQVLRDLAKIKAEMRGGMNETGRWSAPAGRDRKI
jgi:uncharacterized membrane protein